MVTLFGASTSKHNLQMKLSEAVLLAVLLPATIVAFDPWKSIRNWLEESGLVSSKQHDGQPKPKPKMSHEGAKSHENIVPVDIAQKEILLRHGELQQVVLDGMSASPTLKAIAQYLATTPTPTLTDPTITTIQLPPITGTDGIVTITEIIESIITTTTTDAVIVNSAIVNVQNMDFLNAYAVGVSIDSYQETEPGDVTVSEQSIPTSASCIYIVQVTSTT